LKELEGSEAKQESHANMIEDLVAWVCIGITAAIAGWIWPFRRGVAGIAVNILTAIAGAIAVPLLGVTVRLAKSVDDPKCLALAAIGAVLALAIVHAVWGRSTYVARHARRSAR
jgi:uncharacterized membrane protein YeaQ/YmgE (transglycosylase-associated protein family)